MVHMPQRVRNVNAMPPSPLNRGQVSPPHTTMHSLIYTRRPSSWHSASDELDMANLSEATAPPAPPCALKSIWDVLQRGASIDRNKTALIAPAQPAGHLHSLVGPSAPDAPTPLTSRLSRLLDAKFVLSSLVGRVMGGSAPNTSGSLAWTFAQLERGAARLGSALDEAGVKPCDTVLFLVSSCAEWALFHWVCALKMYTYVTLDMSIFEKEDDLRKLLPILAPSVVVTASREHAVIVDAMREKSDRAFVGICLGDMKPLAGWTTMAEHAERKHVNIALVPPEDDPDRVALVMYTSGTSGTPKGCVRRVGELVRSLAPNDLMPLTQPPLGVVNTRNFHGIAPSFLFASWYSGNGALLPGDVFRAETTLSAIAAFRPLALSADELMTQAICTHKDYSADAVRSLRLVMAIGAVVTLERLRWMEEVFPNARIAGSWGMTEASMVIGWPGAAPKPAAVPVLQGVAAAGKVLPGGKIKIVRDGNPVPRGSMGVLHVCADRVTRGYVGGLRPEAFYTDNVDNWFITGDCAVMDEAGHLFVMGRDEHMIRNKGRMLAPATIENLVRRELKCTVCWFPLVCEMLIGRLWRWACRRGRSRCRMWLWRRRPRILASWRMRLWRS